MQAIASAKKYTPSGILRLAVFLAGSVAASSANAGFTIPYKCADKNGAITTHQVEISNEYYLTALIRTLGMRSVEEYEASGLDCRTYSEWARNVTPRGAAALKKPEPPPPPKPGPFTQFAMGDYLDSIYNGDIERLKRLDKEYLGKQLGQFEAGMSSLGPLGNLMTGAMQLDKASLVNPTMKAYVSSYGDNYGNCLRKDAVQFTITRTDKSNGVTLREGIYRMNSEFAQAFKETYSAPSIADLSELSHPLVDINNGVRQIMNAYKCNDPVIKRFESQLLDMYTKRQTGRN